MLKNLFLLLITSFSLLYSQNTDVLLNNILQSDFKGFTESLNKNNRTYTNANKENIIDIIENRILSNETNIDEEIELLKMLSFYRKNKSFIKIANNKNKDIVKEALDKLKMIKIIEYKKRKFTSSLSFYTPKETFLNNNLPLFFNNILEMTDGEIEAEVEFTNINKIEKNVIKDILPKSNSINIFTDEFSIYSKINKKNFELSLQSFFGDKILLDKYNSILSEVFLFENPVFLSDRKFTLNNKYKYIRNKSKETLIHNNKFYKTTITKNGRDLEIEIKIDGLLKIHGDSIDESLERDLNLHGTTKLKKIHSNKFSNIYCKIYNVGLVDYLISKPTKTCNELIINNINLK